jgi:uncharacterized protein (DUF2147 family)
MRKNHAILAVLFVSLIISTSLYSNGSPAGQWRTIDDETGKAKSIVEIYEQGGAYYGKVVKLLLDPQDRLCDKCKGDDYNKPIVGMVILKNLKQSGSEYSGGSIMDPNNGKTYRCLIELQDGGNKLRVRGYMGFSLIGRNQFWHRVK